MLKGTLWCGQLYGYNCRRFHSMLSANTNMHSHVYIPKTCTPSHRTLPLSLFIGIPIVATCYLLVNFAFFSVLTYEEILSAETVAIVRHKLLFCTCYMDISDFL